MKRPVIIAVAGGSASGKTTVVEKIIQGFDRQNVTVIKHDDYYKDQSDMPMEERIKVNYDHPFSLDNDLMFKHLLKLIRGEQIIKPTYDFENHNRSDQTESIVPTEIIILEGILIMEDNRIRELCDIKLFVEADDDLRFIRRLTRDMAERGRSMESVIKQYLNTVKPMHFAFVKPTKRYADVIIPNDKDHDVAVDLIITKIKSIISEQSVV
ncbi:uridine kinase [Candidatus Xianfuyuplasma coldseepsis]|uniref:Uridine kinase n=1 Tax=Candidatus Xianfuyuplasma coldseepsis TaxID=2782163 RepID=A0A7L7KSC2_9MOLU|nr:uridine kinase [Xianfuyuplasma coldseepsis]QMS85617.1 uridine kinase [Xianfuyuplasma coldseepsis]